MPNFMYKIKSLILKLRTLRFLLRRGKNPFELRLYTRNSNLEEYKEITSALESPWQYIACHGGDINDQSPNYEGGYNVLALYILANNMWFEISSQEINEYYFELSISKLFSPPVPDRSKINTQKVKLIKKFPKDLPLEYLKTSSQNKVMTKFNGCGKYGEGVNFSEIKIKTDLGHVFLLRPSDQNLCDINICYLR